MRHRNWIITVSVGVLMLMALSACSHGRHSRSGSWDKLMSNRISRELDLDASQRAALDLVVQDMVELRNDMSARQPRVIGEMRSILTRQDLEVETLDRFLDRSFSDVQEVREGILEHFVAFHRTLSAEQKVKLVEHLENASQRGCRH